MFSLLCVIFDQTEQESFQGGFKVMTQCDTMKHASETGDLEITYCLLLEKVYTGLITYVTSPKSGLTCKTSLFSVL